jgi:predicted signal transduction protein with EAL and GGDEF domain
VEKVVRSLLQAFVEPFEVLGREVFSSTSVGISLYPKHGGDTDELLNCADIAMYHAKEAGGCRYAFFQQNMREPRLIKQAPAHQFAPRPELRDYIQEMHLANRAAGQSESLSRPA